MPDLFDLVSKWWKQILALVILTLITTAVVVYTAPKKYLGVATALPAPTFATDKRGVFGENVETLYPGLGTSDDLDFVLGTSKLDTVYNAVAEQLGLTDYYAIDKSEKNAVRKAGSILKGRTRVIKSDYGELKVKVWDASAEKAADMANAVMEKLQQIHQDVQTVNNDIMLQNIKKQYETSQAEYQRLHDSLLSAPASSADRNILEAKEKSLIDQVQEYEKLLSQYNLMVTAKPQALIITERASPALWPDKPKPKQTLLAAAVLSIFFGFLLALIFERRRMVKQ
ncbi:MAG: hypothetical protein C4308_06830 [Chitinophagaceae bacterium]